MKRKKDEPIFALTMTGRHITISEAMRDYAEKKISRLHRYFERNMEVHIIVIAEKRRYKIEVVISANGDKLTGASRSMDIYSSIDEVVEKLEKQLIKLKEKYRERKRKASQSKMKEKAKTLPVDEDEFEEFDEDMISPSIVKFEKVNSKPMSPDEAAMQMDLTNRGFYVFMNSQNDQLNVIYRLNNGKYAIITKG